MSSIQIVSELDQAFVIATVGHCIEQLVQTHASCPINPGTFDLKSVPNLPIASLARDFVRKQLSSSESLIMVVILLERLVSKNWSFVVTPYNIHRLFVALTLTSAKFLEDRPPRDALFGRCVSIGSQELASMERALCCMLSFEFFVHVDVFNNAWQDMAALFTSATSLASQQCLPGMQQLMRLSSLPDSPRAVSGAASPMSISTPSVTREPSLHNIFAPSPYVPQPIARPKPSVVPTRQRASVLDPNVGYANMYPGAADELAAAWRYDGVICSGARIPAQDMWSVDQPRVAWYDAPQIPVSAAMHQPAWQSAWPYQPKLQSAYGPIEPNPNWRVPPHVMPMGFPMAYDTMPRNIYPAWPMMAPALA